MYFWNEEEGVYEFRSRSADETAKLSAAASTSAWVRQQLEWYALEVAPGSGHDPAGAQAVQPAVMRRDHQPADTTREPAIA